MIHISKQCYEAIINTSEDGRGPSSRVGYFTNYTDAHKAVKGKSAWGSDGTVQSTVVDVKIYETFAEFENVVYMVEYNAALAKLTPKERLILGLDKINESAMPQPPTPPEDRLLIEGQQPQKPR